jgi:hypothetical protein
VERFLLRATARRCAMDDEPRIMLRIADPQDGADEVLEALRWRMRHYLEALRGQQDTAFVVDPLLAQHEECERRRKERRQQRAAPQQGPVGDSSPQEAAGHNDVGWDF